MAKVQIDIPEKLINEHAATKIKQLEDKLSRSEKKVKKLENQLRDKDKKIEDAKSVLSAARVFLDATTELNEFWNDYHDNSW